MNDPARVSDQSLRITSLWCQC